MRMGAGLGKVWHRSDDSLCRVGHIYVLSSQSGNCKANSWDLEAKDEPGYQLLITHGSKEDKLKGGTSSRAP